VIVKSLFLQQPERIEALGLIVVLALLMWRVRERALRTDVDTTSPPLPGWDKHATARPTAFMMVTTLAGVMVFTLGHDRPPARCRWSNSPI
jgi:transposase